MALPSEWQSSYIKRNNYPENLISRGTTTYRSKLVSYRKRLDDAEADLCLIEGEDEVDDIFEIPIIDHGTGDGKARDKKNIHTPSKLTQWLGVEIVANPNDPSLQQVVVTKRDPRCRFIYFYAQNSRDKLKTTRESLTQILSYHQVMPAYMDFMLAFGAQSDARDLRFSGFREQISLKTPPQGNSIPSLGRSRKIYQLCYNLKGVKFKKQSNENIKLDEWSIRQAAIHHQFDIESGTTLWIVTKGGEDILDQYKELTGPNGRPEDRGFDSVESCFRSTLSTQLLLSHWSTEEWRWYIRWLEDVLDHESGMAIDGLRGEGYAHKEYKPYHIQDLQHWQDKANEAVMVLESNAKILKALRKFYADLVVRKDFPSALKTLCEDDLAVFFSQLDEIISDFQMQISRAVLLKDIINDRKELVLQHLQGQAAERTEQLNRNLEREAIVMRIVTLVTLLYLPATFVSTFFSTDVVKYQGQGGGQNASFSSIALKRWLQVTLPLTAFTLLLAWATYKIYGKPGEDSADVERTTTYFQGWRDVRSTYTSQTPRRNNADAQTNSVRTLLRQMARSPLKFASHTIRSLLSGRSTLPFYDNSLSKNG